VTAAIRSLPPEARALIDAPEFAVLSTINPDGSQHQCVMWVGRDGDELLMSTRKRRPQHRNLLGDSRASVLLYARARPTSYVTISGNATLSEDSAGLLIDELAQAYTGRRHVAVQGDDRARVTIRIPPERVHVYDASAGVVEG
jgi:PPOX class probable F420-dependent enzyme